MREIYSKTEDDQLIQIEVDVDASEFKEDCPWLFSVFIKSDGLDKSIETYEEFLETKESLIIALEHENVAHYLGSRVVDGWSEFYFCASSSKKLDAIVLKMLKGSDYLFESNVVKDTKWGFYETQLFPTELEIAHIQSSKIIFLLEEEGEDVSVEREVEHYAVFDTASQKNKFINTILDAEIGFKFKDDLSSEEYEHGVAMVKTHVVSEEEVKKVVELFFAEVKKVKGFYEGWSTTLVTVSDEEDTEEEDEI